VRKLLPLVVVIAVVTLFSCSSQYGPTVDEAYAGAWIGASELGVNEVIEMTDTTCVSYVQYQGLGGYLPAWKGFILKESDTSMFIVTTDIYQLFDYTIDGSTNQILPNSTDGEYTSADEADSSFSAWNNRESHTYVVSGDTITFDGSFVMTRTNPVSDSLLE